MNPGSLKQDGLVVLISSLLVLIIFHPVILDPNHQIFIPTSDGLKNYYTVLYYLQNDHGLHFSGMNYPFGEHLSFADAQVGLTVPFKWLCGIFPQLADYGIALINLSMILGLIPAVYFTYKLLQHFNTAYWLSVAGAVLIVFLSPQLFRFLGHYGLSYVFFFPLCWYLFIKASATQKISRVLICIVAICWVGLLHFYLALILTVFLAAYVLINTISRFKKENRRGLFQQWVMVLSPLLLLKLFMTFTDSIKDRPSKPWGFFFTTADFNTVFTAHPTDLLGKANKELPGFGEGFAYVGVAVEIVLVIFIAYLLYTLFTGKIKNWWDTTDKQLLFFMMAAVLTLLFSMGIPFRWGLESLLDKIAFIRQFRSPGRFAWAFYYVAGVFSIKYLHDYYNSLRNKNRAFLSAIILALLLLTWITEDVYRIKTIKNFTASTYKNYLQVAQKDMEALLIRSGVYKQDYQAILAFPFYHIGSEKFSIDNPHTLFYSLRASLQWQLPLINVYMSRTSLEQSCKTVQLTGDTLIEKKILSSLNEKPILLLACSDQLNAEEKFILNKAQKLATSGGLSLYKILPAQLKNNTTGVKENFRNREMVLKSHDGYWSDTDSSSAIIQYAVSPVQLTQGLGFQSSPEASKIIYETATQSFKAGDSLLTSLWIKIDPAAESVPLLRCEQLNASGTVTDMQEYAFKWSHTVYEECIMASCTVKLKNDTEKIKISLQGPGNYANLLIRSSKENIYIPFDNDFYFNNIPVQ